MECFLQALVPLCKAGAVDTIQTKEIDMEKVRSKILWRWKGVLKSLHQFSKGETKSHDIIGIVQSSRSIRTWILKLWIKIIPQRWFRLWSSCHVIITTATYTLAYQSYDSAVRYTCISYDIGMSEWTKCFEGSTLEWESVYSLVWLVDLHNVAKNCLYEVSALSILKQVTVEGSQIALREIIVTGSNLASHDLIIIINILIERMHCQYT